MKFNSAKVRVSLFGVVCICLGVSLLLGPQVSYAQRIDGDLTGTVKDATGALVPGAKVTVTSQDTGLTREFTTGSTGSFFAANLLPGTYIITVEMAGFGTYVRRGVRVIANRLQEVEVTLEVGAVVETVEVGAELVETQTSTLTGFSWRAETLTGAGAQGSLTGNPINLAILAPGTTTQPGGVVGVGGAIGGNRPRQNNFVVDGLDNNDPSVTGPLTPVIAEAVAEFTLLTNQFAAEFGHSTAGQFIITTATGTNDIHGSGWWYIQNRTLNSRDNLELDKTLFDQKRFDWNRFGGKVGGPILKDKWFAFGAYEYRNLGLSPTPSAIVLVPTSAGLARLESLASTAGSGVSAAAVGIFSAHVPAAPSRTDTFLVCNESVDPTCTNASLGVPIDAGQFKASTPNFDREHVFHVNTDVQTARHRFSGRFNYSRERFIVPGELPVDLFNTSGIFDTRRITFSDSFTINPSAVNELRLGYTRDTIAFPVQDITPPAGTDVFGNYAIEDMNLAIGPQGNFPQSGGDNIWQLADNFTWTKGQHTFKTGLDVRAYIAPSKFLPRARGDYIWTGEQDGSTPGSVSLSGLDAFVRDQFPNSVGIRGVGSDLFAQDRVAFYAYLQDSWRIHPRVTLDLGVRYEFTEVARDSALQDLNGIANAGSLSGETFSPQLLLNLGVCPDLITCSTDPLNGTRIFNSLNPLQRQMLLTYVGDSVIFRKPRSDVDNWAPRLGIAWDIFGNRKTSFRAGIARGFDVTFGNLPLLQLPPQFQAENREANACVLQPAPAWCANAAGGDPLADTSDIRSNTIGFLEGGALLPTLPTDAFFDPIIARNASGAFIPNEQAPETWTWSGSLQREMWRDYLVEVRYVGTHALRLPVQRWLSAGVPHYFSGLQLPVFTSTASVPARFPAGTLTRAAINNVRFGTPAACGLLLCDYGFFGVLTQFSPVGRSSYHGGSIKVERRPTKGLLINGAYTWSRTIDMVENELFTSFLNPRRGWNMFDPSSDRGLSGIHRKHKFTLAWVWDISGTFKYTGSGAFSKIVNGWQLGGTYLAETGQPITILAARDVNGDFDSAGDRVFFNAGGTPGVGSDSQSVCWDGTSVTFGCTASSQVVGYVSSVDNAQYIRPGLYGAGNLGRNTFLWHGINNWNLQIGKKTSLKGEGRYIEFSAQFLNAFNHPSFALGAGSVFQRTGPSLTRALATPGESQFLDEDSISASLGNSPFNRTIQLSVRVVF